MTDTQPRARPPRQEQEPASEEVTEVVPGVLRMQLPIWMPGLGHVNMYGLADDRGLAVIDPGLPGPQSWKALKQRLKTAGYRVKDVHTVVVTHSHPDHFGGAGRIAREAGAKLDHASRVLHVDGEGPEPAARALRRRSAARRDRGGGVRAECRRSARRAPDDQRSRRRARRHRGDGSDLEPVGRDHAVGHDEPRTAAQAALDDQGDAGVVLTARTDRSRASRRTHPARRSRLVRRAHAGSHRRPPVSLGSRSRARCSPAITCSRRSRRTCRVCARPTR